MRSASSSDSRVSGAQPTWVVGRSIAPESRIGSVIEGEYQVSSVLRQGELGTTYLTYNPRLKRQFAVLLLNRELGPTNEMMLETRRDLKRAQSLPGIMPMRQVHDADGIPGFATEILDGETLRQRLFRGALPVDRALALVIAVAQSLEGAHRAGLVHGDLRPENILLVRSEAKSPHAGKVLLLDHSLRHLRRRPRGLDDTLPISKLMYRPPELVADEVDDAGVGGDVFTLGAILYECLSGHPAFGGPDVEAVLDKLSRPPAAVRPNPVTGLTEGLCQVLNVVLAQACARTQDARTPGMGLLSRGLQQVQAGAGLAVPAAVVEPTAAPPKGRMSRLFERLSGVFPTVQVFSGSPRRTDVSRDGGPMVAVIQPPKGLLPGEAGRTEGPRPATAPGPARAAPEPARAAPEAVQATPEPAAPAVLPVAEAPEPAAPAVLPVAAPPEPAAPAVLPVAAAPAPLVETTSPPPHGEPAVAEGSTPAAQGTPPAAQGTSPAAQGIPPTEQGLAPTAQGLPTEAKAAAPAQEPDRPAEEPAQPAQEPAELKSEPAAPKLEPAAPKLEPAAPAPRIDAPSRPVITPPPLPPQLSGAQPAVPRPEAIPEERPLSGSRPESGRLRRSPMVMPRIESGPAARPVARPPDMPAPLGAVPVAAVVNEISAPKAHPLSAQPVPRAPMELQRSRPVLAAPSAEANDARPTVLLAQISQAHPAQISQAHPAQISQAHPAQPPAPPQPRRLTRPSLPPAPPRPTRPTRARDITQLVAAVQAGQIAAEQAVELARVPVELIDGDIYPTGNTLQPLELSEPLSRRNPSAPSGLRRFLLAHQELAAAMVGGLIILLLGVALMWCQGP